MSKVRTIWVFAGLLLLPGTVFADSISFGFAGGIVNASSSLPYLTNDPAQGGVLATLTTVAHSPNPPGPSFGGTGSNLGTLLFTTGPSVSGNLTSVLFAPGGSVTIISNNAFQTMSGVAAGTTLFQGSFTGSTIWTQTTCVGAPLSCGPIAYTLSGTVAGTFDPALLVVLNLGGANLNGSIPFSLAMSFANGMASLGTAGAGTIVTPEPGTLTLFATGLMGAIAAVRRKVSS